MTPTVQSREVLHYNIGTSDKLYVIERLERGGATACFTTWGKRGGTLRSAHVSHVDASRKQAEKLAEGYRSKASTIGLDSKERDMGIPLTSKSIYEAVLPAAAAASPTVDPATPKEMSLSELRAAFSDILRSGAHKSRVDASAISLQADGTFRVQGSKTYTVTLNPMDCDCPAHPKPCKHLVGVIASHGDVWLRAEETRQLADAMGIDPAAAPVDAPAPVQAEAPKDPIMAIFEPYCMDGESHPMVPLPERIRWNEKHARRIAAGFRRRKPTLLFGPTGTGKTSMVRAFAAMTNRPMLRINMTPSTSANDLVGKMVVRDGATVWQDGPLTQAMRFGYILIVDEADRIDPGTSSVLFPAMEDMPTLTLKEGDKSEVIEAHPDFSMFLTANAMGTQDEAGIYTGTQAVDAALISRCGVQVFVDYNDSATETQILVDRGIARRVAEKVVRASVAIRSMIQSGSVVGAWGTRQVCNWAENTTDLHSYEEGFAATAQGSFCRDEFKTLWEACQRITGTTL